MKRQEKIDSIKIKQTLEQDTVMTQMLELSDKDEAVVIRMLQQKIANMFKTNKRWL